ncbi:MAG: amidohydrolase family protein, partial [Bacilli bacterium]|nr:amidohydrolase family protein [Bacilli bacterium]
SNNSLDMFKEMTLVYALQKVTLKDPTALPAFELLKMATVNGAKAMGLKDLDYLEEGKLADIIEIDLMRPNMQPINNIVNNIVFSGSKENIKMTMVNGRILYADGRFYIDEPIERIYEECQRLTGEIENKFQKAQKEKE